MRFHPPRANKGATDGPPTGLTRFSRARSMPTHMRKGLSWPANATDLYGLGRRLSARKKISLACAPGDSYASSTHLIQCIPLAAACPIVRQMEERVRERWQDEEEKTGAEWTGESDKLESDAKHNASVGPYVRRRDDKRGESGDPSSLRPVRVCVYPRVGTYVHIILFSPLPSISFHSPDSRELVYHLRQERCASALRDIHAFPFLRTCRSEWAAAVNGGTVLVQVFWPTCAPQRRASRPRYLARGKLLGETLKPFCSYRDRETCRSLSRCSPERSENTRYSSRMSGVITPVAFIAVIARN